MVLCIEIDQETKARLDELLTLGQYRDYSQAIAVAIANQVLLHGKVAEQGRSLIISKTVGPRSSDKISKTARSAGRLQESGRLTVPSLFSRALRRPLPEQLSPIPTDAFVRGTSVPVDRWIFGQHNKLLPAKASCRALAILDAGTTGVPLARTASDIAAHAVELGDYLRAIDEKNGFTREESLSLAFPLSGSETGDKARLRYANQFVASTNAQGQLSGLLVDLKFVNYVPGKEARLMLTEPGWEFAVLENPILDHGAAGLPKFTSEEVDFLLGHIRNNVPAEDSAYRTVITALSEGANNPDKLDAYLKPLLSPRQDKPFTTAFLATQRSGVISRMSDLGLVSRQRDGVKVTYIPSERAIEYLKNDRGVRTA